LLRNKVAIISGASKDIRFSMVKVFSETHGAIGVVCSRDIDSARMAMNQINGNCTAEEVDVSNEISVIDLVKRIMNKYGKIDILINNAGFYFDKDTWYKRFHQITREELASALAVDLWGSFYMSIEVIKASITRVADGKGSEFTEPKNNCNRGAVIIKISSTPALEGYVVESPYTIAKSAILDLTKCIAKEYAKNNIRCYTLILGNIATMQLLAL
jgi:NAD(P)-dependent dehydrogenase (short-subunit alcohol dehydrogenase family)